MSVVSQSAHEYNMVELDDLEGSQWMDDGSR